MKLNYCSHFAYEQDFKWREILKLLEFSHKQAQNYILVLEFKRFYVSKLQDAPKYVSTFISGMLLDINFYETFFDRIVVFPLLLFL